MNKRNNMKRIIVILGVVLCAVIGFFFYRTNFGTNSYARNLDLGKKYLLDEDYDDAISAFSDAIDIDGTRPAPYIGRGDAYKGKGDYENAWSDYEKAEELSGDNSILSEKIGPTEITVVSENGEGIDGAVVYLDGASHSYELMTDYSGHISTVLFPERYEALISKDEYGYVYTELSVENGGVVFEEIQLEDYSQYEEDDMIGAWSEEDETPYESYFSSRYSSDADFLIGDWCSRDGTYLSLYEDGYYYMQWGISVEEEGYWYAEPIDENVLYIEIDGTGILNLMTVFYGSLIPDYHFEILKRNDDSFYFVQVHDEYTAETSPCRIYFERIS